MELIIINIINIKIILGLASSSSPKIFVRRHSFAQPTKLLWRTSTISPIRSQVFGTQILLFDLGTGSSALGEVKPLRYLLNKIMNVFAQKEKPLSHYTVL